MKMTLRRTNFRSDGIFGELLDDVGNHFCYTLEHSFNLVPAVPVGEYICQRGQHQLAHMDAPFTTYQLLDVPGHTNILIHKGNYNVDSEGCILLGTLLICTDSTPWMLGGSAPIFNKFLQLQSNCPTFTLTVENP